MRPPLPDLIPSAAVVRFLLASETVPRSAIVRGDLRLVTSTRDRFALHQVQWNEAVPYVVKTARDITALPYLFGEGAVLEWLQAQPALTGIGPRCHARSVDGAIVVLERIPGDPYLGALASHGDAAAMAKTLALLHRGTAGIPFGVTSVLPPVFDAICRHRTPNQAALTRLRAMSPDPARLLAGLSRTAREWRRRSLVHSDVKREHWFSHSLNGFELRLIDWELVRLGDPAWDVAGALHDWVSAGSVDAAAATFAATYRHAAGPQIWADDFGLRVALSTATRLSQTALERLNTGSDHGVGELLHRADEMFRRPEPFAEWIGAAAGRVAG